MELRLKAARTTRDIDLAIMRLPDPTNGWDGNVSNILEMLREAGQLDLQDFFTFVFGDAKEDLDGAPYGGARFSVEARLAASSTARLMGRAVCRNGPGMRSRIGNGKSLWRG
jgi:hypothetical protein